MLDICQLLYFSQDTLQDVVSIYVSSFAQKCNNNYYLSEFNPTNSQHTHMRQVGGRQAFTHSVSVILKSQLFLLINSHRNHLVKY